MYIYTHYIYIFGIDIWVHITIFNTVTYQKKAMFYLLTNFFRHQQTFTNNYHLRRNISINWLSANFFSKRAVNVYFHLIKRHSRDKFVAMILICVVFHFSFKWNYFFRFENNKKLNVAPYKTQSCYYHLLLINGFLDY